MYIGPETLMPLASALAAIGGLLMLFWHRTTGAVRAGFRAVARVFARLARR